MLTRPMLMEQHVANGDLGQTLGDGDDDAWSYIAGSVESGLAAYKWYNGLGCCTCKHSRS